MISDNSDLSPCPDCGKECKASEHDETLEHCAYGEVYCLLCRYNVVSDTRTKAIRHHERLAGRCRWELIEYMGIIGKKRKRGCDGAIVYGEPPYCEDCGKKVEEVSE